VAAEDGSAGWRGIDALGALVGHYGWLEWRIFELSGAWAARPGTEAEVAVWSAAVARRHGDLALRWAGRLPVRAGVDAGALVRAPSAELADVFERLAVLADAGSGVAVLVSTVLPWLGGLYLAHLETASPVSEAPVAEVLVEAACTARGEARSGRSLRRNLGDETGGGVPGGDLATVFERVCDNIRVFPAARAS
jgi:hypothetical protein